jgi:hypothetical protein
MMRALIFVCLAGAAAYALIPTSEEPEWGAGAKLATAKPEPLLQVDQKLRSSWGPTLKSLGRDPEAQPVVSQQRGAPQQRQEAVYWQGDTQANQASQPPTIAGVPTEVGTATAEHVALARVILAAKAHSEASVSSPITKFYPIGTELQIVGRESGWIELLEPATQERGFVFEKYLVAIDGPCPARTLTQASAEPLPAVAPKAASPAAQTQRQASARAAGCERRRGGQLNSAAETKRDRLTKKRRGASVSSSGCSEAANPHRGRSARRGKPDVTGRNKGLSKAPGRPAHFSLS